MNITTQTPTCKTHLTFKQALLVFSCGLLREQLHKNLLIEPSDRGFKTFTVRALTNAALEVKHKHLLRERGGRAVCQWWGGRAMSSIRSLSFRDSLCFSSQSKSGTSVNLSNSGFNVILPEQLLIDVLYRTHARLQPL